MFTLILPKILTFVTYLAHNETDVVTQSLKKQVLILFPAHILLGTYTLCSHLDNLPLY